MTTVAGILVALLALFINGNTGFVFRSSSTRTNPPRRTLLQGWFDGGDAAAAEHSASDAVRSPPVAAEEERRPVVFYTPTFASHKPLPGSLPTPYHPEMPARVLRCAAVLLGVDYYPEQWPEEEMAAASASKPLAS